MAHSCCSSHQKETAPKGPGPGAAEHTDPVCGMRVIPAQAAAESEHRGTRYYFCAVGCKTKFDRDPEKYLGPKPAAPEGPLDAEYTCPMHPEVLQIGPGTCPICGMALDPKEFSLDQEEDQSELHDMRRRFLVSLPFAAPLVWLSMFGRGFFAESWQARLGWVECALATPVVLWCGLPFFQRFLQSLRTRHLNMFTLIGMGVAVAYLYSLLALLAPGLFPDSFRSAHHGQIGLYFEAASVIVALVLLGQLLELKARSATGSAIRALLGLAPKTAWKIDAQGRESEVEISALQVGDRIRVRPGEKVPVDARVEEGSSPVDESMVSGEAIPVEKGPGALLIGGTLNGPGALVARAERVGKETMLAQIVKLVAEAQRSRAPIQSLADRVASYFVPAVMGVALLSFLLWGFFGPEPRWVYALVNAVSVLIIACPCALGLATPMAIVVAAGRGAGLGILFRNAEAIELLGKVDCFVVDKTGTLTEGKPRLVKLHSLSEDLSEDELLRLAASVERASEHPLARAIVQAAEARGLALDSVKDFRVTPGKGARGRVSGWSLAIGSAAFLQELGVDTEAPLELVAAEQAMGRTCMYVAAGAQLRGLLVVADPVKASSKAVIETLRGEGISVVMLTGDHERTAAAVAAELGIPAASTHAGVLPADKARIVKELQGAGKVVGMLGDGINDAPALSQAHVGIAMGTGTDIAMQSAGITLVNGDLSALLRARRLSRLTMSGIRQNLFFAFAYNTLGVPVAAGFLYPFFGLLLNPMLAAAAMSLSSVSVIANSLRLRSVRLG